MDQYSQALNINILILRTNLLLIYQFLIIKKVLEFISIIKKCLTNIYLQIKKKYFLIIKNYFKIFHLKYNN